LDIYAPDINAASKISERISKGTTYSLNTNAPICSIPLTSSTPSSHSRYSRDTGGSRLPTELVIASPLISAIGYAYETYFS
jgi:hypothetical protein